MGKLGQVVDAIRQPSGATLAELSALTGWLPHTTRAALSRVKQRGFAFALVKTQDHKAYRTGAADA